MHERGAPGLSAPCCSCMRCPASSMLLTCTDRRVVEAAASGMQDSAVNLPATRSLDATPFQNLALAAISPRRCQSAGCRRSCGRCRRGRRWRRLARQTALWREVRSLQVTFSGGSRSQQGAWKAATRLPGAPRLGRRRCRRPCSDMPQASTPLLSVPGQTAPLWRSQAWPSLGPCLLCTGWRLIGCAGCRQQAAAKLSGGGGGSSGQAWVAAANRRCVDLEQRAGFNHSQ